jgi:hypothetical protein
VFCEFLPARRKPSFAMLIANVVEDMRMTLRSYCCVALGWRLGAESCKPLRAAPLLAFRELDLPVTPRPTPTRLVRDSFIDSTVIATITGIAGFVVALRAHRAARVIVRAASKLDATVEHDRAKLEADKVKELIELALGRRKDVASMRGTLLSGNTKRHEQQAAEDATEAERLVNEVAAIDASKSGGRTSSSSPEPSRSSVRYRLASQRSPTSAAPPSPTPSTSATTHLRIGVWRPRRDSV